MYKKNHLIYVYIFSFFFHNADLKLLLLFLHRCLMSVKKVKKKKNAVLLIEKMYIKK